MKSWLHVYFVRYDINNKNDKTNVHLRDTNTILLDNNHKVSINRNVTYLVDRGPPKDFNRRYR